jgi:hypothetical protein
MKEEYKGENTCSWCEKQATKKLTDKTGWVDHACDKHAKQWGNTYK